MKGKKKKRILFLSFSPPFFHIFHLLFVNPLASQHLEKFLLKKKKSRESFWQLWEIIKASEQAEYSLTAIIHC